MADLKSPQITYIADALDAHRRRVPVEPHIELRVFTEGGAMRRCPITTDEALRLIAEATKALQMLRHIERSRAPRGLSE